MSERAAMRLFYAHRGQVKVFDSGAYRRGKGRGFTIVVFYDRFA